MKDCAHIPELGGQQAPARKPRPTIEELREYLNYDPETGVLRWKKRPGLRAPVRQGQTAGRCTSNVYRRLQFRGHTILAHRVAFALHHGRWPTPCCDHIDGNPLNNRATNLRECSVSNNAHNRKMHRSSATGVKGVSRLTGGYLAEVMLGGVRHRKWFRRLEDAAAYVKQLREQFHGEFARHE